MVEVKSNIGAQWDQVERTISALHPLVRVFAGSMSFGEPPGPQIPAFAVGYNGWKSIDTLKSKIDALDGLVGALVLDPGLYYSKRGLKAQGPHALWAFICDLHGVTVPLQSAATNPISYLL